MIGMRESKEDMRENMRPTSDLDTIFETIERIMIKVAVLIAPTDKPGENRQLNLMSIR